LDEEQRGVEIKWFRFKYMIYINKVRNIKYIKKTLTVDVKGLTVSE